MALPHPERCITMIVSIEKLPEKALALLSGQQVANGKYSDEDLAKATVLMCWPSQISEGLLRKTPNLSAIQTLSAGVDDIPYSLVPSKVRLFSNANAYSVSVAEHAWSLVLALAKGIGRRDKSDSRILFEKTLLILGCGGIGSEAARMGRGFGMKIIGLSRSFLKPEHFDEKYTDLGELDRLLGVADVLICTLPVNKFTTTMLDYDKLKITKPHCIIVNVSRAEIFDENGILKLLKERPETRFGTDVFWRKNGKEVFESKLWDLPNFLATKHTGGVGASRQVRDDAIIFAAKNVLMYLNEGKASNEIRHSDYA